MMVHCVCCTCICYREEEEELMDEMLVEPGVSYRSDHM